MFARKELVRRRRWKRRAKAAASVIVALAADGGAAEADDAAVPARQDAGTRSTGASSARACPCRTTCWSSAWLAS